MRFRGLPCGTLNYSLKRVNHPTTIKDTAKKLPLESLKIYSMLNVALTGMAGWCKFWLEQIKCLFIHLQQLRRWSFWIFQIFIHVYTNFIYTWYVFLHNSFQPLSNVIWLAFFSNGMYWVGLTLSSTALQQVVAITYLGTVLGPGTSHLEWEQSIYTYCNYCMAAACCACLG